MTYKKCYAAIWMSCFFSLLFSVSPVHSYTDEISIIEAPVDYYMSGEPIFRFSEEQADDQSRRITARSYPSDPFSDISWSAGMTGVADVQAAFNGARQDENSQLGTSVPMMTLPSQSAWDAMNDGEKALWLINRERMDRGIDPLHGLEDNVTSVAQYYAQYLIDHDAWGHTADGNDPWGRLDNNPEISQCHDFLSVAENLAVFWTSGSSIPLPIERSVFNWMYDDGSCCSWGHRHAILWHPYTDNGGTSGTEGFLGIGRANGPHQEWNYAEMIVMNVFDPCSTWDYGSPIQIPPTVTTVSVTGITQTSANSGGSITSDGGSPVTARGVCWSTSQNPTTEGSRTVNGSGTGTFASLISGLSPDTTYYVRAYATNSAGTSYGTQYSFATLGDVSPDLIVQTPLANPAAVSAGQSISVSCTVANQGNGTSGSSILRYYLSGNAICDSGDIHLGYSAVSPIENGGTTVLNGTVTIPTGTVSGTWYLLFMSDADDSVTENDENNNLNAVQISVSNDSLNWVTSRAEAVSLAQSQNKTILLLAGRETCGYTMHMRDTVCELDDPAIKSVIQSDYIPWFCDVDTSTEWYPYAPGLGTFYLPLICRIDPDDSGSYLDRTTYVQDEDIFYNRLLNAVSLPSVSTLSVSAVTQTSVSCGGNVTTDGGAAVTARGVCWSTSQFPTISSSKTVNGSGTGIFTGAISGLSPGTTYFVRAYATNSSGTAYGQQYLFTTLGAVSPDLVVLNPTSNPTSQTAGQSVTLSCSVRNQGAGSAGNSRIRFYLSANTIYENDDLYLGYNDISTLNSGVTATVNKLVTIPSDTASGNWNVLFIADADNDIAESDESNNSASVQISVASDDLVWITSREEAVSLAASQNKMILLLAGSNFCGYTTYMRDTVCEMEEPPINQTILDHYIPWFSDTDTSTEWWTYAYGLGTFYLPLISRIDPADPDNYLDRSTGMQEVNAFYARLISDIDIPGDINDNPGLDLGDAILALQISAGFTAGTVDLDGEVDGDDRIGVQEAIYVLRKLAQ